MIRLRQEDWSEIFYALETKLHLLQSGQFGDELAAGEDAKWTAHLRRIMRKIGPDGTFATERGLRQSRRA